jgi:hypothetical protein
MGQGDIENTQDRRQITQNEKERLHAAVKTCRFVSEQVEWGLSVCTLQVGADHDARAVW